MIKNTKSLLAVENESIKARRKIILDIIEHVISATSPHALLEKHLKKLNVSKYEKVLIIAIGKAARTMGVATAKLLKKKPSSVFYADNGHPLPTPEGIKKTNKIIKAAKKLSEKDLAIVLVSGGGSAMFVQPAEGITLEDKIETTRALLMCGATINEVNCVRKHLSQVKGGRLAQLLYPATIKGFVISDVVGNDQSTIASGPLCSDTTTFKDALKVLTKYKAPVPNTVYKYIENNVGFVENESIKKNDPVLKKVTIQIIADHYTALREAEKKAKSIAKKTKHSVHIEKKMITGEARDVAQSMVKKLKKHSITIACGETTVTCCTNPGDGGRNQEYILSALQLLKQNQTIASFGTDGIDGMCPIQVAGAIGDKEVLNQASSKKLNIEEYLKNNDSYAFFNAAGGHILTGPTGNNLGDIVIAVTQ